MNTNNNKPVNIPAGKGYSHTSADDEKDKAEFEWKMKRAKEAIAEFMRRHPDGRVIPRTD